MEGGSETASTWRKGKGGREKGLERVREDGGFARSQCQRVTLTCESSLRSRSAFLTFALSERAQLCKRIS